MPAPLDNPRHERFAALVAAGGKTDLECYQIALGSDYDSAQANAWRLKESDGIKQRIHELKCQLSERTVLTMAEKRDFLRKIVTTPPSQIDEDSPLCQGVKRDRETGLVTEVKIPDKLRALELDAKLAGELDGPRSGGVNLTFNFNQLNGGDAPEVVDVQADRLE